MAIDLNKLKRVAAYLEAMPTNSHPAAHEAWEILDDLLQLAESEPRVIEEHINGYFEQWHDGQERRSAQIYDAGFRAGLAHYLKRPA